MTRDEEIKLIAECAITDEKYNEFKEGIIWGANWADKNPKPGTVNKQEFIERACKYLESVLEHDLGYYGAAQFADNFREVMEE